LAMALVVSQSDDRGEPKGNCDQARAQQSSHDSILLRNTYTTCRRSLSKEKEGALSPSFEDRLTYVLLLDEVSPYLCHPCQCLGDLVGGHALCLEIQDHAFFIVAPKDAINEIIPTSPQDMDRAHGALLLSA